MRSAIQAITIFSLMLNLDDWMKEEKRKIRKENSIKVSPLFKISLWLKHRLAEIKRDLVPKNTPAYYWGIFIISINLTV